MPTGGQVWFTRSKPASGSSAALPVGECSEEADGRATLEN
jgi:hypothetical protein